MDGGHVRDQSTHLDPDHLELPSVVHITRKTFHGMNAPPDISGKTTEFRCIRSCLDKSLH